jgi:prepilin-type N-terminal cleavage/methylation domain-containing protein
MIATFHRAKRLREEGEIDGFTLFEILIVIVVLGVLAAIVIFALGTITGKSAIAACQADGATVSSAIAAFNTQNPGNLVTPAKLLTGTVEDGDTPYLQSMPANLPHYDFVISTAAGSPANATAGGQLLVATLPADNVVPASSTYNLYMGPTSCLGVS